jgi:hypothetical protein
VDRAPYAKDLSCHHVVTYKRRMMHTAIAASRKPVIAAIAPLPAGLGLFFCAVHFVSVNLIPLAGRSFPRFLDFAAGRPVLAALTGIAAGTAMQSTKTVTTPTCRQRRRLRRSATALFERIVRLARRTALLIGSQVADWANSKVAP